MALTHALEPPNAPPSVDDGGLDICGRSSKTTMSDSFRERWRARLHAFRQGWRTSVLVHSFPWTARLLVPLAVPTLLVSLPVAAVGFLLGIPVIGDAGAVINGRVTLLSPLSWPALTGAVALTIGWALAQTVALAAAMLIAAGAMLGRNVPSLAALRVVLRRAPATLTLGMLALLAIATIAAAGLVLAEVAGQVWLLLSLPVLALPATPVMQLLLAVPAVLLEGRPVRQALGRARHLAMISVPRTEYTLLAGTVVLPVLAWWGLHRLVLPHAIAAAASGMAFAVLSVLTGAFQAVLLSRIFLVLLLLKEDEAALHEVARRLPDAPPAAARRVWVLAASALLPGLVYGGTVLINPLGWVKATETSLAEGWAHGSGQSMESGGLGSFRFDLKALYPGADRPLTMVMDSSDVTGAGVFMCDDADGDCTFAWSDNPRQYGPVAAGTRLADGRVVLAVWNKEPGEHDHRRALVRLGLLICDRGKCTAPQGGKPISGPVHGNGRSVAIATRPNGGLVVAWEEDDPKVHALSFAYCDDPICSRPERRMSTHVATRASIYGNSLALVVGPDDRLVAALADAGEAADYVLTCADAACTTPHVARSEISRFGLGQASTALSMALRADGRPIIAQREAWGSISLLDCRDQACTRFDDVPLAADGSVPALSLDAAGRALVAYLDKDTRLIMLASCARGTCDTAPVARARHGVDGSVTMMVSDRGQPVIAWLDDQRTPHEDEWELRVTVVRDGGRIAEFPVSGPRAGRTA